MKTIGKTIGLSRFFTLSLATAGLMVGLGLASVATAQEQMTPEQACTGDAQSLCGEFIPARDKVGACLRRNARRLSPACRGFVVGGRHVPHGVTHGVTHGHPYVHHHVYHHHYHHHN